VGDGRLRAAVRWVPRGAGVAAGSAVGASVGPVPGALAAAVLLVAVRAHASARRARARARESEAVVEVLVALASELQGGREPSAALGAAAEEVGARQPAAVRAAVRAARSAGDVPAALDAGPPPLRALAAAWRVTERTGAPLRGAVTMLADGGRAHALLQREIEAALAGPRTSAHLLAGLPALGLLLAAGLGARPAHVLLHTPIGLGCLSAGVALDLAGWWWTSALVRSAQRAARP